MFQKLRTAPNYASYRVDYKEGRLVRAYARLGGGLLRMHPDHPQIVPDSAEAFLFRALGRSRDDIANDFKVGRRQIDKRLGRQCAAFDARNVCEAIHLAFIHGAFEVVKPAPLPRLLEIEELALIDSINYGELPSLYAAPESAAQVKRDLVLTTNLRRTLGDQPKAPEALVTASHLSGYALHHNVHALLDSIEPMAKQIANDERPEPVVMDSAALSLAVTFASQRAK